MLNKFGLLLLFFCLSAPSSADWQLDNNNSWLSFVTVKKMDTTEQGKFKTLTGTIDKKGQAELKIDLASVDTNIPVRDERINKFLFQTAQYAEATISTQLDLKKINKLPIGDMQELPISVTLNLHGIRQNINGHVTVTRLTKDKLLVISKGVIFVKAADFNLIQGIEILRQLAALPHISRVIPVMFVFTFNKI
jgi:polyisoprenoid-binding protein YceI